MTGREIVEALKCGKPGCACRNGKLVHCPSHDDAHPSLSITEREGKALLKCHTGCTQDDLIAALKERGLWGTTPNMPIPIRSGRGQLTVTYGYVTLDGELVAEHGRFEGPQGKSFAWRIPGKDWRDGLGTLAIHDLPLYGLVRLVEAPDATVWVVEGEKAADAAYGVGLAAVCLGGGAAQQTFGNALDVLRDRDVVLWPDNDEAGAALMGRLAALLPQARYVRPIVPPKGDAYDYFAAGGTVDGLEALLEESSPIAQIVGDAAITVIAPVPAGRVRFEFTGLDTQYREVNADLRVVVDVPAKRRTPYSRRMNLTSVSTITAIRRELEDLFGKELGWSGLLSEACDMAQEAWHGVDRSFDLADTAMPEVRKWTVESFAPEGLTTILFGMGGSGKSLIGADLALHCLYGMPWMGRATTPVGGLLVIDYEDTADEWHLRVQQLCDGYAWPFPERGFRYMPGRAIPLADQVIPIRRIVEEHEIGLIIVDSAISACGGDLMDTKASARLINSLTDLGATSLLLAHNTKAGESMYPYGNIFWHNLVRATHYIETVQEEGAREMDSVLHNRKSNRGLQKPISMHIAFSPEDTGPTTIDLLSRMPDHLRKRTLKDDVESFLREGANDATTIANALKVNRSNVADLLSSDPLFTFVGKSGKRALYGLLADVLPKS